jgi:hypothetical protein
MSPRSLHGQGLFARFMALIVRPSGPTRRHPLWSPALPAGLKYHSHHRTSWFLLALVLLGARASAQVPGIVHVPMKPDLVWQEIERLRPGLWTLRDYEGTSVQRFPGEIVVVLTLEPMKRRKGTLAVSAYERRLIVVYVREVERLLGTDIANPKARIALARIIAHELEHVRRQSVEHDADGFFKSCLSRDYLLTLFAR